MESPHVSWPETMEITLPLESNKRGPALWTEKTLQNVLDTPEAVVDHVSTFRMRLHDHYENTRKHDPLTARYYETQRARQLMYSCIGAMALARALPDMITWFTRYNSLIPNITTAYLPPEIPPDFSDSYHPVYARSMKVADWLDNHAADMLCDFYMEPHKGRRPLWDQYEQAFYDYFLAAQDWKEGPGHKQWPNRTHDCWASKALTEAFIGNMNFAFGVVVARTAWYTMHKNPNPTQLDLANNIQTKDIVALSKLSTMHRHADKEPGSINAKKVVTQPAPAWLTICKWLAGNRAGDPLELIARKYHMVAREDGCPHASIQAEGWATAANCAGSPLFSYSNPDDRDNACEFFGMLGLDERLGQRFNLAIAMLAMAHSVAKDTIYPLWPEIVAGHLN